MTDIANPFASGKTHRDENFPVASWLVRPDARAPILAFYHFARAADDIADHPTAPAAAKLAALAAMRAGLTGESEDAATASALAAIARERGLDLAHAHDLLAAFGQDVHQARYEDWEALIAYCRLSAMPVGRFVLDVHGEDRGLWPLSDALCAALQIINHLQDCGKDYHALGRVYMPQAMLREAGAEVAMLGEAQASPALRGVIIAMARQTQALLATSADFAAAIRDARLAAEVAVIQALAEDLTRLLLTRDPLQEAVHHTKPRATALALTALLRHGVQRLLS